MVPRCHFGQRNRKSKMFITLSFPNESVDSPPSPCSISSSAFFFSLQVFDILWSDPQHTEGCIPNKLRGAGSYFGPDVTRRFTQRYKLMYVVRSHECKPEGYEVLHDGKVITIFSASNYYEIGSNKGAYMKLDPQLDIHFVQYTAAASKTRKLTFRQRVGLVESSAIRELAAQLRDRRDELEQEFLDRDADKTGKYSDCCDLANYIWKNINLSCFRLMLLLSKRDILTVSMDLMEWKRRNW